MGITFDTTRRHIVLDSTSTTAAQIWSRWVDWHAGNRQWATALTQQGGALVNPTLGIYTPIYFFLENGWRVRPMEANHNLTITGNLFVSGGGVPVVSTLGTFQVNVNYTVPVQAQGISTSGSAAPTAAEVAAAVLQHSVEGSLSLENVLRILLAPLAGKANGIGTGTENYLSQDGTKQRVTATFDTAGNRIAVAVDGT